jgi:hypothetical protein
VVCRAGAARAATLTNLILENRVRRPSLVKYASIEARWLMTRHRFAALIPLMLLAAAACGPRPGPQTPGQPSTPQALDPLTAGERAAAEKLVRADPRAAELLGERATLASIEFLAMKSQQSDEPVRHADLLFARPDTEYGARAIVRLGAAPSIVEFTRVDRKSVPMTEADVQDAWQVALADPAYRKRITRNLSTLKPEALRIYTEDRNDPCFAGRCFYVIVRDGDYYISDASVTVDLATKRILPERSPK